MEIRQIQYFLSIVETGSFSNAAEELYISQSSLSKQIIALEEELGVQLFDRSKRKIFLTNAGEVFLEHARKMDELYKALRADIDRFSSGADTLSIVAIPVMAQYGIPSLIAHFKNTYPNIKFTLDEREGINILPALKAHEYDLAFIRDNYIDKNQFQCITICEDELDLVVSLRHQQANRPSISLKELSNENFIMFDKVTILHDLILDECTKAGFRPRIFYASVRIESILGLVASNIGVALMAKKIFDYYNPPDLVAIPLDEVIKSNVSLVYLTGKKLSGSARTFIDLVTSKIETEGHID